MLPVSIRSLPYTSPNRYFFLFMAHQVSTNFSFRKGHAILISVFGHFKKCFVGGKANAGSLIGKYTLPNNIHTFAFYSDLDRTSSDRAYMYRTNSWRCKQHSSQGEWISFWVQSLVHRLYFCPWWRHQMETFSALLAICAGNSPVPSEFPHKSQWRGALMFSLICARINDRVNNREAGDLRRNRDHYDVMVMSSMRCKI